MGQYETSVANAKKNGRNFIKTNKSDDPVFVQSVVLLLDEIARLEKELKVANEKAKKYDEIDEGVAKFYPEDEDESEGDLCDIGEFVATKLGYL